MEIGNKEFFDQTSEFYDAMINAEEAIKRKLDLFQRLEISKENTADLGCGSGVDSIALYKLNNKVDAFDPSPKMIKLAKNNSTLRGLGINFNVNSIEDIPTDFDNKYSFICSLGNTIANVTPENLRKVFVRMKDLLKSNGKIFIQILNYDLLLSKKERIISINQSGNQQFIRFYDFQDDNLIFNILQFSRNDSKDCNLISTKLYPHKYETINEVIKEVGFKKSKFYGNFNLDEFKTNNSKDLVMFLTK